MEARRVHHFSTAITRPPHVGGTVAPDHRCAPAGVRYFPTASEALGRIRDHFRSYDEEGGISEDDVTTGI
jgi:hypothetical protein